MFPTMIQLMNILGGIHQCISIISDRIFDTNVPFGLQLNHKELENWCTDYNKPKLINGYKGVYKYVRFFPTEKNKFFSEIND